MTIELPADLVDPDRAEIERDAARAERDTLRKHYYNLTDRIADVILPFANIARAARAELGQTLDRLQAAHEARDRALDAARAFRAAAKSVHAIQFALIIGKPGDGQPAYMATMDYGGMTDAMCETMRALDATSWLDDATGDGGGPATPSDTKHTHKEK